MTKIPETCAALAADGGLVGIVASQCADSPNGLYLHRYMIEALLTEILELRTRNAKNDDLIDALDCELQRVRAMARDLVGMAPK